MPAFAAILAPLEAAQALRGARIACTLPRTAAATTLVDALQSLGAAVRWTPTGRGRASDLLDWPSGAGPNLLIEHGAAASQLIHAGTRAEGRASGAGGGRPYAAIATAILGTTEVDARGARWLARRSLRGELLYPAIDGSAAGPFDALPIADGGQRGSAALSLLVLSQVALFRDPPGPPALTAPPAAAARAVAEAHDDVLRRRIEKLRGLPGGPP
jgi:hypothetical protein